MAVHDNDIELLHAYLDGELPVAECEGLWRRLTIEQELMSELDRLRADYAIRTTAWSSLEPTDQKVARLESGVMRAVRRSDWIDRTQVALRLVTSVAALLLLGFTVGWMGRERYFVAPAMPSGIGQPSHVMASEGPQLPQLGQGAKTSVVVYDGSGKPITLQFDSIDEANRFLHDFRSTQMAPTDATDLPIVPAMDKF